MDFIINFINSNQTICVAVVGFLLAHFGASIHTATTKTKNTKFYKLIETIALVVKQAKDK